MSKNIIFEYGTGNDFIFSTYDFFTLSDNDLEKAMFKTLGTVRINTKKLYRPKIKVEFSSNIHFISMNEEASIKLEFILTRKSQGFDEVVLKNVLYEITNTKSNLGQSFNFTYYDKDLMEGIHIYSIKTNLILAENCKVVISNCNISVFAYLDCEYEIEINNKEKVLQLIEHLLNEEMKEIVLNVQEDSRKVVKAIEEVKKLMGEQSRAIFSAIDSLNKINTLVDYVLDEIVDLEECVEELEKANLVESLNEDIRTFKLD